jgi:hypothetical protein
MPSAGEHSQKKLKGHMIRPQYSFLTAAAIFGLLICVGCQTALAAELKRVLALYSFGRDFKSWSEYAKAMRTELNQQSRWPLEIIDLSLVTARSAGEDSEVPFVEYLRALFAKRPLDLTVSIGAPAANFVQRYRPQLFPTTPMALTAVEQRRIQGSSLTENDTVVASAINFPVVIENISDRTFSVCSRHSATEVHREGAVGRRRQPADIGDPTADWPSLRSASVPGESAMG